ncbi:thioredoxin [Umezakia ovalisporum]|jgi:thioredoxin 1|uniref:Thioredoxin n=2 Tax=Umezakia ovalisporum TaxID=75695 RepID=A0AA43GXM8_9CYAN|nr:thioredoxin [Umezakia ovalisporum]MBI1241225.1 thioredoxin [Nostoc sp. RI_552]MDH6057049.1 thioredoxin [Umezakia ovalisporum FSS-43]MDH6063340.1 thioredoxin [Umezakia ovalisporum FSS-62]MDH6068728.1 thioredoxin [Umezakia ovalisporum APH033B]MDH6070224.1 thioredoxin [Umezakia ovalisporum CobakiLakeA]
MTTVEYIQEHEFKSFLSQNNLVVVDFTATWCGPCKMVSPLMDKLAEEFKDRAKVVKLDLDQNQSVAKSLGIRSIPTVIFFKNGEPLEKIVGVVAYEKFSAALTNIL